MTTFDHIHICCSNLNAMVDFWVRAFGAVFVRFRKFGPADGAVVSLGGTQIFIKYIPEGSPMPDGSACGLNHIGLRVEDPDGTASMLISSFGGRILNRVSDDCLFVTGPEGLVFELMRAGADV